MDEKQQNIYLVDKIAQNASRRRAILSYNKFLKNLKHFINFASAPEQRSPTITITHVFNLLWQLCHISIPHRIS